MVERKDAIAGKASEEKILCKICGKEFKNYKALGRHLITHKITSKEYYDKFLKKENEGICPVCRKETTYLDLRRGYRKFCSNKCAQSGKNHPNYGKHLSEETKKKISDANKGENNPNYGKRPSDKTRKKMSDAKKRRKSSSLWEASFRRNKEKNI
jgi:endogenous inhibitor of DNA gyrase (YacG/DUF329 family)